MLQFYLDKSELCAVIKNLLELKEKVPINKREVWESEKLNSAINKLEQIYINMKDDELAIVTTSVIYP